MKNYNLRPNLSYKAKNKTKAVDMALDDLSLFRREVQTPIMWVYNDLIGIVWRDAYNFCYQIIPIHYKTNVGKPVSIQEGSIDIVFDKMKFDIIQRGWIPFTSKKDFELITNTRIKQQLYDWANAIEREMELEEIPF